jgi:hypothetical protein
MDESILQGAVQYPSERRMEQSSNNAGIRLFGSNLCSFSVARYSENVDCPKAERAARPGDPRRPLHLQQR